jgi:hypothetical protein
VKTAERAGLSIRYVEVTREDIAVAGRLMANVLHDAVDDLPPAMKQLLEKLDTLVTETAKSRSMDRSDVRFSRREVRERFGLGGTQLWQHLRRLVDGEYVLVHPSRRGRGVVYELAYTPANGSTTPTVRGAEGANSGDIRPPFGANSGGVRGDQRAQISMGSGTSNAPGAAPVQNAHPGPVGSPPSYTRVVSG